MVVVDIPPGMTPEQAREEVRRSIAFGSPEVRMMWILEPDPQVSSPDQI
jgi:hypothetical protein